MLDGFQRERHEYAFRNEHMSIGVLVGGPGSYPDVFFYRWGGNLVLV